MADYIPNPYDTYEPPENPNTQLGDEDTIIEININAEIIVDDKGYYEYTDESYSWAKDPNNPKGDWYDGEYNIYLGDPVEMVEHIDDIMIDSDEFPTVAGHYKVTGTANLAFNISGIEESPREYFTDYGGDTVYDSEIYTEYAEADFNKEASSITDLKFIRI